MTQLGERVVRMCGPDCNEVETSDDLATIGPQPGGGRFGAGLVAYRGAVFMIGGNQADVMRSEDGLIWTVVGPYPNVALTTVTQFTPR